MGATESVLPKEHKTGSKSLDLSRDVSHKAFIKHSEGEINYNCLTEFPWELRDSITLYEKINASFNHLTSVPEEIPLRVPHLTQLILSYNKISELPETFLLFFHLQELDLDNNELVTMPKCLTKLLTLEKLNLSNNHIKELPEEIGELQSLTRLNLCGNKLKMLPATLAMCPLKVVLLQNNRLEKPSQSICDQGSSKSLEALRAMSTFDHTSQVNELLDFPRVRGSHLMISSQNPSSMHLQYTQLQIFPDRVKTPLIPPTGSSNLEATDLRDRIIGLIYGAAIGDALALATEGLSRDECSFYYEPQELSYGDIIRDGHRTFWKKGDWSTSFDQMVLVLDSLLQWAGIIDELEFAKRLQSWCTNGFPELGDKHGLPFSDIIQQVVTAPDFLVDPHRVAASLDAASDDDAAIVRAIIIGVPFFHNLEEVMDNSTRICKTTHSSPTCTTASALLSGIVSLLLQGKLDAQDPALLIKQSFVVAQQYLPCKKEKDDFEKMLKLDIPKEVKETQNDCMKSLCLALQSLYWFKDFRSTLLKVIMNGGDCKVAATITGALHGALTGYSALPKQWVIELLPKQTQWLNVKINHLLDLMAIP